MENSGTYTAQNAKGYDAVFSVGDNVKIVPKKAGKFLRYVGFIGKIIDIDSATCKCKVAIRTATISIDFCELVHYKENTKEIVNTTKTHEILAKLREDSTTNDLAVFIPWAIYEAHKMYREQQILTKEEFADLVDLIICF